jgi:hypothetical protein
MLANSARVIHIGLNYQIAPKRPINIEEKLEFQKQLNKIGLEADNIVKKQNGIGIKASYEGIPVVVEDIMNSPNTGQLLILMPENPNGSLFPKVADEIGRIYLEVFKDPKPQVIPAKDGCIRKVYSCKPEYEHAFAYIWEKLLGKSPRDLQAFDKPIQGGGLRFVMPPQPGEFIETQVKIESLLADTKLLWVEVIMKWIQPEKVENRFKAAELYSKINDYLDKNVVSFMVQ